MNRSERRKRDREVKNTQRKTPKLGTDEKHSMIVGFTITLFVVLLLYYFVSGNDIPLAHAETFNITLTNQFNETEAGFHHLLIAECIDSVGASHEDNITFTIGGVDFEYSPSSELYYGAVSQNTPQTIEYGVLTVFTDTENATSTATILQNTTVTWTTNTLDRMEQEIQNGNWIGAILNEQIFIIGALAANTFITGAFSIAAWQVVGVYGVFLMWFLGWGLFASQVHGNAQIMAIILFSLGVGIMVAKLYLDRRTS